MIQLLIIHDSSAPHLLFGENVSIVSFVIVKESNRQNKIPPGFYVVKFLEYKEIKGKKIPFVSLIKKLNDNSFVDFILDLSELSPSKQVDVVTLLERHISDLNPMVSFVINIKRIKNILNCISLHDRKTILFPDVEPRQDEILKELDINFEEVQHALLRDRQRRESSNFQGGFHRFRKTAKEQKGEETKLDSSKKMAKTMDNS